MAVKHLVSDKDGDHLPITGDDGKPDHHLMGAAWAALHGGYRGNKYNGANKQAAIDKLKAAYKSEGMDTPDTANHAEGLRNWFEVFRAGNYGDKGNYTEQDLQHVADSFNPDFHEPPAVIGHPESDAPAFGWVAGVKHEAGKLFVKLGDDVDPQFEDMVRQGKFKKRSVSFYRKPEGLQLRHIGFLGAQPPEVKGLAAIKFEEGFETSEVEFQEGSTMATVTEKTVREQITEFFAELFKGEKAGGVAIASSFSEADAKRLIDAAVEPLKAENTDLKAKLAKQATDFAERETKIQSGELQGRVAEAVAKLRSAGRWVPAFAKMGLTAVFADLAKSSDTVEFGEGDAKQKLPALDVLVNFIEKLPKFGPQTGQMADGRQSFSEAAHGGVLVDSNSVRLNELAKKRAKDDKINFCDALTLVAAENPTLTQPGASSGGHV